MKRLYERAGQLLRPTGLELGQGADPRVIRALRLTADELRVKAEHAYGGYADVIAIADFDEAMADIIKTVARHVWRELLDKDPPDIPKLNS